MSSYYVYHLIDPRNSLPFYVGKGIGNRMYSHVEFVKNNKIPHNNILLFNKIKKVLNGGLNVIYDKVVEGISEESALKLEMSEISKYGRKMDGGILCNLTLGGEGISGYKHTDLSKTKMSQSSLESDRLKTSIENLQRATMLNTGKRKLKPQSDIIYRLYKTHSTTEICDILNCDLGLLIRFLKENGWYVRHKNRKKVSKEICKNRSEITKKIQRMKLKPILQFSKDGKFIKKHENAPVACEFIKKPKQTGEIYSVCRGTRKSAFGFIWRYE